jgi:hypothetical protein
MTGNSSSVPRRSVFSAYAELSGQRRRVLPEALVALAWSSFLIRCLPFRTVMRLAGGSQPRQRSTDQDVIVRELVWAIEACARRVPWRAVCFQQGLAVHLMLRRRGIGSLLHYGVRQGADGLKAHVWVTLGGADVIGGPEAQGFACLATYPPAATRS